MEYHDKKSALIKGKTKGQVRDMVMSGAAAALNNKKATTLKKGRGRDGSMEHKATGLRNTRKIFD